MLGTSSTRNSGPWIAPCSRPASPKQKTEDREAGNENEKEKKVEDLYHPSATLDVIMKSMHGMSSS